MIHRIPKVTFEQSRGRQPKAGDWMYQAISCVDFINDRNAVYETRVCSTLHEAAVVAQQHDVDGGGKVEIYWFDICYGGKWRLNDSSPANEILQDRHAVSEGVF